MFSDFFINLCILIAFLSVLHLLTNSKRFQTMPGKAYKLLFGISSGLLGVLLMHYSVQISDKAFMDLRSVPIIIGALFGGPLVSILAAMIISAARVLLFDFNNITAVATVVHILLIGLVCGWLSMWKVTSARKITYMMAYTYTQTMLLMLSMLDNIAYVLTNIIPYHLFFSLIACYLAYRFMKQFYYSQEMIEKLKNMATKDFLTGVNNVREFDSMINTLYARSRQQKEPMSLLFMDVDYFKKINDTYGHPAGDAVLKELGQILEQCSRPLNIVSRNGGEEFSILLPNYSQDQAFAFGEKIRNTVQTTLFSLPDGKQVRITVSIGISCYAMQSQTLDEFIKKADLALYRAKQQGRNQVCL